jgi:hypothetical protein
MDLFEYITIIYESLTFIIEELQMEALRILNKYGGFEND